MVCLSHPAHPHRKIRDRPSMLHSAVKKSRSYRKSRLIQNTHEEHLLGESIHPSTHGSINIHVCSWQRKRAATPYSRTLPLALFPRERGASYCTIIQHAMESSGSMKRALRIDTRPLLPIQRRCIRYLDWTHRPETEIPLDFRSSTPHVNFFGTGAGCGFTTTTMSPPLTYPYRRGKLM